MGHTHNEFSGTLVGNAVQAGDIDGPVSIKAVAGNNGSTRLQISGRDITPVDQNILAALAEHLQARVTELTTHLPHSRPALDEVEAVIAIVKGHRR